MKKTDKLSRGSGSPPPPPPPPPPTEGRFPSEEEILSNETEPSEPNEVTDAE
jgi:hypothetical protein